MKRYPTPEKPGHYWAKLVHPSGMPDGEEWKSLAAPSALNSGGAEMDHILASLDAASDLIEKSEHPICEWCGATSGLRISCDGGLRAFGWRMRPAEYVCEGCFTGTDTGPSFDDLPIAEEIAR